MAGVANETPAALKPATPIPFSTPRREIIDLLPTSFTQPSDGGRRAAFVQEHHLEIGFRQV
jgi:hypothetical protein